MIRFQKTTLAVLVGVTLAGCGGQSFEEDLLQRAEEFDAMAARVDRMALSGPNVVNNTTGSASFSGGAAIIAGTETNATILIGDADVNVNFNGATDVSGSITNVAGLGGANLYIEDSGSLGSYSGNIALSNGFVGPNNYLAVDYAGTLNGNGDRLVLNGTMDGYFLGNPEIRALQIYDSGYGTLNGATSETVVGVIAERD